MYSSFLLPDKLLSGTGEGEGDDRLSLNDDASITLDYRQTNEQTKLSENWKIYKQNVIKGFFYIIINIILLTGLISSDTVRKVRWVGFNSASRSIASGNIHSFDFCK